MHLILNIQITSIGYDIDAMKKQLYSLRNQNRYFAALVSSKTALDKIDNIASNKLKMVVPKKIIYIYVSEESATNKR